MFIILAVIVGNVIDAGHREKSNSKLNLYERG